MKKFLLSFAVIIAFAYYALLASTRGQADVAAVVPTPSSTGTSSRTAGGSVSSTGGTSSGSTGKFRDGTYTGPVANAYFGNFQVRAVVSGGRLTDVQVMQYPNDRGTSRSINARSNPILVSEAIAAQSGTVDVVSGATQSSQGFSESLNGALAMAAK